MTLTFNRSTRQRELVSRAISTIDNGLRIALATLVNIEGNAPYPVGTQMLVAENGQYFGQITGGCAEKAIADQAVLAIQNGVNLVQRYGLNSPFFDIQLPCGSGIDVHFNCEISRKELEHLESELQSRHSVTQGIQIDAIKFEKIYQPDLRLMVFGQGPILVSLAELGLLSGFDVACVAQNKDSADMLKNAGLDYMNLDDVGKSFSENLDNYTGFVSLFHEHELEVPLLSDAVNTQAFYIGALGSKRTHEARLDELRQKGVDQKNLLRIKGPVGTNIGANTPAQIAISILAEVVAHANGQI